MLVCLLKIGALVSTSMPRTYRSALPYCFALPYRSALAVFSVFGLMLCCLLLGQARAQAAVPQAVGVATGTGGLSWVLWNNPDSSATLWKVNGDTAGTVAATYSYGPFSGWTARSIAAGSDGVPRILWTNTSGQIILWTVNVSTGTYTYSQFGPYSGWTATALAICPGNTTPRLLLDNSDGRITLWNVDAAGDQPGNGTSTQFMFGAFTGYTAAALALGGDNVPRILWTKPDGSISLWKVDASGGFTHQEYGPYSGWTATVLAAGPDGLVRIPWLYSDGTLSLWKVDTSGGFTFKNYGPYSGWSVRAIAVGADNSPRPLWDNVNGSYSQWRVATDGTFTQVTYPVPASVSLNPTSVNSNSTATGTLTLNCPSPYGGTVVSLSSSNTAAATAPSSVTVAAGQTSATFVATSQAVSAATSVTITASYNGVSQTATLTVNPSAPAQPTGLTATASGGQVLLSWAAPSGQVTGYKVLRRTPAGAAGATPIGTVMGSPPAASYTDTAVFSGGTYFYKVIATNGGGDGPASAEASATLAPGTPTGFNAYGGSSGITLAWTGMSGVVSYNLYRGTASGAEGASAYMTGVTVTRLTDPGAASGQAYYYQVTGVNAGGEGARSAEANAVSTSLAPALLEATAQSGTQNSLTWTTVTGATSYNLYRSTTAGGEGTSPYQVNVTSGTGTGFTDSGLTAGTTYYYKVIAVGPGGEGASSNEASATPGSSALPAARLKAVAGNAQVALTWSAVTGATSYNLYRTAGNAYYGTLYQQGLTNASYTDTGLTNGTQYAYYVCAVNTSGQGSQSNTASATPGSAALPGASLTARASSSTQVALAWTSVTGAASYNVYRSTTPGAEGSVPYQVGLTSTSTSDTGLATNTTYYYQVSSVGSNGEGALSNEASATPGVTALPAPTITATASTTQLAIRVAWSSVPGATSYNLYRSSGTYGYGGGLYQQGLTSTSFMDTSLLPSGGASYYVTAVAKDGEGTASTVVSAQVNGFFLTCPSTVTVMPGAAAAVNLTLTPVGTFAGGVVLSGSATPAGTKGLFYPAAPYLDSAVDIGYSITGNLYLNVGAAAARGSYPITITGTTASGFAYSTSLTLTVQYPVYNSPTN